MIKSKEKLVAARNRVAAGKRAGWPLSPAKKKVLRVLQVLQVLVKKETTIKI